MNLISLFTGSILTGNLVLSKFLGICPFIGTSNRKKNALVMGGSVLLVITTASVCNYLLYHYILVPTNTTYLRTIVFILFIAALVQLIELVLKKNMPMIHRELGLYLPLITTNCAVLGVCLMTINLEYTLLETLVYSIGSSLGFTLVSYVFASIRQHLALTSQNKKEKGYPLALVIAAIMALLFARFHG